MSGKKGKEGGSRSDRPGAVRCGLGWWDSIDAGCALFMLVRLVVVYFSVAIPSFFLFRRFRISSLATRNSRILVTPSSLSRLVDLSSPASSLTPSQVPTSHLAHSAKSAEDRQSGARPVSLSSPSDRLNDNNSTFDTTFTNTTTFPCFHSHAQQLAALSRLRLDGPRLPH